MSINAEAYGAAAAIGLGVGYAVRQIGLSGRFIPGVVWLCTAAVYVAATGDASLRNCIVGLCAGLSASGLHSGVKNTIEKREVE